MNKTILIGNLTKDPELLIDPIRARVSLRTSRRGLEVRAIGNDGSDLGEVSSSYRGGRLSFNIGPESKTMYYVIGE